jgi:hypothetical protein
MSSVFEFDKRLVADEMCTDSWFTINISKITLQEKSINLVYTHTHTKQKPTPLSQIMFKQSLCGSSATRAIEAQSMNSHCMQWVALHSSQP